MRYLLAVIICLSGNSLFAATLNYISSDSQMSVVSTYADNYDPYDPDPPYYEEYNLTASAPALNLSDYSNTLFGDGFGDSGNQASGTFSGLSDSSGFSMTGAVDNWEAYGSKTLSCQSPSVECTHYARIERTVRFTVTESMTLYLATDWSGLQGYSDFPVFMRSGSQLRLVTVNNPDNPYAIDYLYDMDIDDRYDDLSGQDTHAIDIGPGMYEVRMSMFASSSGVAYGGEYSGMSGTLSVSTVPIPAAVYLFGSALAGLGWMRRKQAI